MVQELVNLQNVYANKWIHNHEFILVRHNENSIDYECIICGMMVNAQNYFPSIIEVDTIYKKILIDLNK